MEVPLPSVVPDIVDSPAPVDVLGPADDNESMPSVSPASNAVEPPHAASSQGATTTDTDLIGKRISRKTPHIFTIPDGPFD